MSFHTGKRPARYSTDDLHYADVRPANLTVPATPKPHGGFGRDFADWLMLGNGPDDSVFPGFGGAGDCFWAGQAHSIMESNHNARRPVPPFSGKTIIGQYSDYCGFDPQTGANDDGTDVHDGLAWHQKQGVLDDAGNAHKIGPYYTIEPGNVEHMWEALWLAECLGVGLAPFPQSAMDQFNAGRTWTYVPGSPSEGGHWIIVVGHPTASVWTGVTWARRQTMTSSFLAHENDETWAWDDAERYRAITGEDFEGLRSADVQKYLWTIADQLAKQHLW